MRSPGFSAPKGPNIPAQGIALGSNQGERLALQGNAVKHFSTDVVCVALALPVIHVRKNACHGLEATASEESETGHPGSHSRTKNTGIASATQEKCPCQKAAQNASQRYLKGRNNL